MNLFEVIDIHVFFFKEENEKQETVKEEVDEMPIVDERSDNNNG